MATYTVNMSNVQEVASQMGVLATHIQNMLADLDDGTKQSLSEWTSDAREAYNLAKAQWDQAAADMARQATKAQGTLSEINNSYANAETQGLGLWGN